MNTQEEEYLTLFQEGDGRVDLQDNGYKKYPRVFFFQKEREVLDYIASLTVGGLFYQEKIWQLRFNSSNCIPLLEVFSGHAVSRWFVERLNKVLEYMSLPPTVQHPLTLDGFVGFWDADGTSFNSNLFASQKDREILDIIVEQFGGGVSKHDTWYQWYLSGEKARELAPEILARSHCPSKAERLKANFEGPSYYELHHEEQRTRQKQYEAEHAEERRAYHKLHNAKNAEKQQEQHQTYREKQKLIREYVKLHPEVTV